MSIGRARIKLAIASLSLWTLAFPAGADELIIPRHRLERNKALDVLYRMDKPGTGSGTLTIEWTDALGRLVQRFQRPVVLSDKSEIRFSLDLRRAVAKSNDLHAHLSFHGTVRTDNRERDANLAFVVPPGKAWRDYQVIIWQRKTAQQYAALKRLGVTAGVAFGQRDADGTIAALRANDLRWYVENVATDFYSAYHRWFPDRPVNWRFQQVKQQYRENPAGMSAFIRDPSLSDGHWLRVVRERLADTVRAHAGSRPLYYSLADEPGLADLSIAWDFDVSEPSLAAMRRWLKRQYGTLSALNRQWGTSFPRWELVMPMTTREAIDRGDENFSAWADFKAWMDEAFARALRAGTDAVHAGDSEALAAIEGAQVPGWGGYDYARLAHAVDVMELYDGGGNLEILQSLSPTMVLLTTTSGGDQEVHRIWRELLRGTRGVILWDPDDTFVHADGTAGERARMLGASLREIRAGLGALFINSARHFDPIAILYSPASFRTQWLLDWKARGDAWAMRSIADSYEDASVVRSAMMGYAQALEHMGYHPHFTSSNLIEQGDLQRSEYRILVLPHAVALSDREAAAVRAFVEKGGVVIADTEPGVFDEHSRRRARSALADLFPGAGVPPTGAAVSGKAKKIHVVRGGQLCAEDQDLVPCQRLGQELTQAIEQSALKPVLTLRKHDGAPPADVSTFVYDIGGTRVIALQRDHLKLAPGGSDNGPGMGGEQIRITLPRVSSVRDLREGKDLGRVSEADVVLDAVRPTLLSVTPQPLPSLTIEGPRRARAGGIVEFHIGYAGDPTPSSSVLHADVIDPGGRIVPHYGGNLIAANGRISLRIPIAANDARGTWRVELRDMASGRSVRSTLEVAESE